MGILFPGVEMLHDKIAAKAFQRQSFFVDLQVISFLACVVVVDIWRLWIMFLIETFEASIFDSN